jgi:hypothetical protein
MDRTSKLLLALIAFGLLANFGSSLLRPNAAVAQNQDLSSISLNLANIANGTCVNRKIC